MCNAIAIGLATQGVGNVVKGVAQARAGAAAKAANESSASMADAAAADAIAKGNLREFQVIAKGSAVVADQRTIQSGTGADVNAGANFQTQRATLAISELDRKIVERNAALEAYGLRETARAHRQAGENADAEGKNAMWGTFLGGAGGIIGQGGKYLADQASNAPTVDKPLSEDIRNFKSKYNPDGTLKFLNEGG